MPCNRYRLDLVKPNNCCGLTVVTFQIGNQVFDIHWKLLRQYAAVTPARTRAFGYNKVSRHKTDIERIFNFSCLCIDILYFER